MKNDVTIEVVNLSGQILYSKENISPYGEHTFSFDTGLNEAYVYVVRIIDTQTEEMWSEKIIY